VGMPAQTIIEKARDWRAELIVIGSHGRSALTRLVVGSVSKQVATESRCSVRVARPMLERDGVPLRIIIGVDGSRGADAAVHAVALRVWPDRTEARLIAVDETVRAPGTAHLQPTVEPWISESQEEQIANARTMLKEAAERLRASGLHVSTAIKEGNPPYVLNAEAEAWQADCVFIGARGVDTRGRFRAGSVSTALVTRAPCSVEIARA
jgi:nucleotide-binding universal stress UspA family protein